MNELQKVEFDLFLCFDDVCKKLGINYFLLCGSALGAVRHGGFIPWDDDLDVGMYRKDYNKFMECAQSLLPKNVFLQNYKSDSEYPYVFAKLRNSNTTFIEKLLSNFNINHGIYIDVFPLDGYPKSKFEQKKLEFMKRNYRRKIFCGFNMDRPFKARVLANILRLLGYNKRTAKTLEKYEAQISKYKVENSNIICSHGNRYWKKDYIPKEYYGKGVYITFESIQARIPEKYDEYLTCLYGDWRTLPPSEEQKAVHPCEIYDTKKSYKDYI